MKHINETLSNYYSPDDIAEALYNAAGLDNEYKPYPMEITKESLQNAIYDLKAIADNQYNSDYWRDLYNTLLLLTDKED